MPREVLVVGVAISGFACAIAWGSVLVKRAFCRWWSECLNGAAMEID